jgi:uncharacterized protein (DUF4415 family)
MDDSRGKLLIPPTPTRYSAGLYIQSVDTTGIGIRSQEANMKNGFFTRYGRPGQVDSLAPGVLPRADAAAAAAVGVAEIVKGIACKGLPSHGRKSAISLRVDPEVLDWFKMQGPGYQTRMNAVLRAYMEASS